MRLKDYQEVADAADMQTLESRLVRFANDLGFGIISGALIVEHGAGKVSTFPYGKRRPRQARPRDASLEAAVRSIRIRPVHVRE